MTRQRLLIDGPSGVRVPVIEVTLTSGETVRLYDTAGPGSDPGRCLPPLREPWITARGDVEASGGRARHPRDAGRAAARRGARA